jgi:hypothetical protein
MNKSSFDAYLITFLTPDNNKLKINNEKRTITSFLVRHNPTKGNWTGLAISACKANECC